ncbi:MAG: glycosyltransferase, partial [Alphaproteobacteria bacterium]
LCALADVVLDIPSFSGGNTTLEALGSGTPVVHLPGRFMRGRLTGGLLARAGLDWGIATSLADYVDRATGIARDPGPWRGLVRQGAPSLFGDAAAIAELAGFLERAVEDARAVRPAS